MNLLFFVPPLFETF